MARFIEIIEMNGDRNIIDADLIYGAYYANEKLFIELNTLEHSHENGYDVSKEASNIIIDKILDIHKVRNG